MMQLFVIALIFGAAAADKLDRTYLPPNSARTAGGNGDFLSAPSSNSRYSGNGASSSFQGTAPAGSDHNAAAAAIQTLRFDNENNGDGNYRFDFETDNKINHQEMGELINAGSDQETTVVRGSYSYEGPDGVIYTVNYIADENGFQATGDHLPVAPEIPEAIQRSIEQNAREEAAEAQQQNAYSGNGNGNGNGYPSGGPSNNNNNNGYPRVTPAPPQASRQYLPPQQQQRYQAPVPAQRPRNQYLPPAQQRQPIAPQPPKRPNNQYLPPQSRNGY